MTALPADARIWFTWDCGAWLQDPPPLAALLTMPQLADLLAMALRGDPLPEQYSRYQEFGPAAILADMHLAAHNEINKERRRAEYAESVGHEAAAAVCRVENLVAAQHRRKMVSVAAVVDALRGEQR